MNDFKDSENRDKIPVTEEQMCSNILLALEEAKTSFKNMGDSLKILPVELKASQQGRKAHKNEILMAFSISELKEAIKMKKIENRKKLQERHRGR